MAAAQPVVVAASAQPAEVDAGGGGTVTRDSGGASSLESIRARLARPRVVDRDVAALLDTVKNSSVSLDSEVLERDPRAMPITND